MTDLAKNKPEYVTHVELGIKTTPTGNAKVNLTIYNANITDYQTQVQSPQLGVNRGYLSNAEEGQGRAVEVDGNARVNSNFSLYGAVAYTDGTYVSFTNAPVPVEERGGPYAFKDISSSSVPGISRWAGSAGAEFLSNELKLPGKQSKIFVAVDAYHRSSFSSSPSP